jgi:chromosome segregation ATPase
MLQLEVQTNESEKSDIYSKLLDIEAITNKAYTQISLHKNKEKGLKMELEQYKNETMLLQRAKANREKPVTNNSKPDTYQVQLNQHMETFEKEIKHQQKLLDSSTKACRQLVAGCDELKKKRSELDDVARQKMQALSQKDSRITLLQQQNPSDDFSTGQIGKIDQNRIKQAQDEFKKEETKWTKDKGAIEKDFDQLLIEFDTLTGTAMDFDSHRMKYEKSIQQLTQDKNRLEGELLEERIKRIGYKGDGGPPNTSDLRKEFRQLIADLKSSHQHKMEQEAEEINKLRSQLQEVQDEKYSKKKRGVTTGIQT